MDTKTAYTFKELQRVLKERSKDLRIEFTSLTKREKDILAKTVKLSEEVGELANDILATMSLQRKSKLEAFDKQNLYEEFADVVIACFALGIAMRVDMDRALRQKLDKILTKYITDRS
ncbi:MAG: MazG-like family protein [Candidatus Roizmanbacteria bacterium]|nr:MazG-like family protein [Candidatus Roizmanbacteria bacterium]